MELPDTPESTRKRVKNTLIRVTEEVDTQQECGSSNEPKNKKVVDDVQGEVDSVVEIKPEAVKDDCVSEAVKDIISTAPESSEELVVDISRLDGERPRTGEGKKDNVELLEDPKFNVEK